MALVPKTFSEIITFTRASTATYVNAAGVLTSAAVDAPRFDYDPVTLAPLGFLIEGARTNVVRNNTMQGAVTGTPGTLPTNWVITGSGTGTLVRNIVGVGTSQGITYIDVQFSGTTSTTGFNVSFEPAVGAPAATLGDELTAANYIAIVGGGITNINAIRAVIMAGRTSLGAATTDGGNSGDNKATLTSTLQRFSATDVVTDAATARMQPGMGFSFDSGVAIDITIRIGLPQLELGGFPTSVIHTSTIAVTRADDAATILNLSPWYNATESTVFAQFKAVNATSSYEQAIWSLDNGDVQNVMYGARTLSDNRFNSRSITGDVVDLDSYITSPIIADGAVAKTAFAISTDNFNSALDGTLGTPVTLVTVPPVSRMRLGSNPFANTGLNGHLQRVLYYPRRLTNTEIQVLTT